MMVFGGTSMRKSILGNARWTALALVALAGCGSNSSQPHPDAAVAPAISAQPASVTVAAGNTATFSVTASGDGLTYQWLRDGSPISGATQASYTTPATVEADDGGMFTVTVSDAVGQVTSMAATLRVDWVRIDTQPHSAIVQEDFGVTLSVDAVASGTLSYQWRKDGANLAGANAANLALAHIAASDAGTYDCVITSQLDSVTVTVTSAAATIQTNAPPTITSNPADVTAVVGDSVSLSVSASGTGTLSYQWRKDGALISGATGATLTLASVATGDAGQYDCVVSNSIGASTIPAVSTAATLTINAAPVITAQPASTVTAVGSTAHFTVAATASGTLSYQWRKGGTNLSGATAAQLDVPVSGASDGGSFDCVVSSTLNGTVASTTSDAATLTVNVAPSITLQPSNVTVVSGGDASFSVTATGGGMLGYQWRKDGNPITGANGSTLMLTGVNSGNAGAYDCIVTNTQGGTTTNATSNVASLVVVVAPATPVVSIAAKATTGKTGLAASTQDQGAGNTYAWTLTNGTITSGQGTPSIVYTAGSVGTLTASVQVTNLAGNASNSADETLIAAAPKPPDLLCPSTVHPNDNWMQATFTSPSPSPSPAATYLWSIVNGSATGTITAGQSTGTIAFAAGAATGSFAVHADALNELGDPTTASCTIQVQRGVWVVKDGGPTNVIGLQPTLAVLPNGRVLVSGGEIGSTPLATAMIYSPATGTWFATAPMNIPRFQHTATVLPDGTVLVAGGRTTGSINTKTAEIFDPATNTWTKLTSALSVARSGHTATLLTAQGEVLLAGGFTTIPVANADLYDPVAKTFTPTGAMNITRQQHTATLLQNGQVLIAGGQGGTGAVTAATNAQSTLEIYDPAGGGFTLVTSLLKKPRFQHGASLLLDGTVLITGGTTTATTLVTAEIFALSGGPATATTTLTTNNLVTGRSQHSSTVLADGRVLLVGGAGTNGAAGIFPQLTAEIYNPGGGTFTATGGLSNGRLLHAADILPDGRVMVAGGQASFINSTNSVEVYDPNAGTWSLAGGQVIGRQQHTTTLLADGRVLVVGGQGAGSGTSAQPLSYLKSAQIYDPATHTWSSTGSLTTGRYDHAATLLSDHRVLVTGGITSGGTSGVTTNSAEIWDPSNGQWTTVNPMITNPNGRRGHALTPLPTGQVLVTGGFDTSLPANYLASAEIYDPTLNQWTAPSPSPAGQATMSSARAYHTATILSNGKVVIIGGRTLTSSLTSTVDGFDPETQSFIPLPDIGGNGATPRAFHTATLLPNGKIFVAGGQIAGGIGGVSATNTTELYDPSTGVSDAFTPNLSVIRTQHAAVLLPNGKVLLTGGSGLPPVSSSELFDPLGNTITSTGSMVVGHYNASAVLLFDGSVMVTAGNFADANTEFYLP
jgi:N-acetylneuraminic acid mutarotase